MAFSHDEERVRAERARAIGLFRYSLISEPANAKLSTRQRGRLVRAIADREHDGPFGQPVRVSRATLDRWLRDWRRGGFDALVPTPPKVSPRTQGDVLELAIVSPDGKPFAQQRQQPLDRSKAQFFTMIGKKRGDAPWRVGTYTAHFKVLRDGKSALEKTFTFDLPPG